MGKSNYHGGSKRDECYFCGCGGPLEEHHVIPQRFGGPDTRENTVELCQLCHQRLERLYDKSFYEWFGIEDESGKRKFQRPCVEPLQHVKNGGCGGKKAKYQIEYAYTEEPPKRKVVCGECFSKLENWDLSLLNILEVAD